MAKFKIILIAVLISSNSFLLTYILRIQDIKSLRIKNVYINFNKIENDNLSPSIKIINFTTNHIGIKLHMFKYTEIITKYQKNGDTIFKNSN